MLDFEIPAKQLEYITSLLCVAYLQGATFSAPLELYFKYLLSYLADRNQILRNHLRGDNYCANLDRSLLHYNYAVNSLFNYFFGCGIGRG